MLIAGSLAQTNLYGDLLDARGEAVSLSQGLDRGDNPSSLQSSPSRHQHHWRSLSAPDMARIKIPAWS